MGTDQAHYLLEIKRALTVLYQPGDIVELRALDVGGKTVAGYFDDHVKLAAAAARLSGQASGIYVVLNTITPALLARSANRVSVGPKNLTQDSDIIRRRYLPVDIDAKRPAGISATDKEHEAAITTARQIRGYLESLGVPHEAVILGDSGNGGHILVRVDLPNDQESKVLITSCLEALAARFDSDDVSIDKSVFNAARIWKVPGTLARKGDNTPTRPHRIARLLDVPKGYAVAPREVLEALAAQVATMPTTTTRKLTRTRSHFDLVTWMAQHDIEVTRSEPYQDGMRYILRQCPFNADHAGTSVAIIQGGDGRIGFKCQHAGCADKKWRDLRELKEPGYRQHDGGEGYTHLGLTDTANAEYLVGLYGDHIRYDHRMGRWLLWRGHHWHEDPGDTVYRLAISSIRKRYVEVASIGDLEQREKVARWCIQSEQRTRLEAAITLTKMLKPVADDGQGWDAHPWLLGVCNGIIALRTGELQPGRPEGRTTMSCKVDYDATAECPRWLQFLDEIFEGDRELVDWLQRALGYAITGDNSEQILFLLTGRGANGKSVLLTVLRYALGDYAYDAPFSTFDLYQRADIPNDLAALHKRRLVTSSETSETARLNEARIKALTGGDATTARFLHREFFTFEPVLKLWLATNYLPRVADLSFGFWRRVRVIPFKRQFIGDADKRLTGKLKREAGGILAWLVSGCLEWQKRGLDPAPEDVMNAVAAYYDDSDPLGDFLSACCVYRAEACVKSSDIYKEYKKWAEETGLKDKEVLTSNAFGRKLGNRFEKVHTRNGSYYRGVGLASGGDGFVTDFEPRYTKVGVFPPMDSHVGGNPEIPSKSVTTLESGQNPSPLAGADIKANNNSPDSPLATGQAQKSNSPFLDDLWAGMPDYPTKACHACGSSDFWPDFKGKRFVCARCHPQPPQIDMEV